MVLQLGTVALTKRLVGLALLGLKQRIVGVKVVEVRPRLLVPVHRLLILLVFLETARIKIVEPVVK